VIAVYSDDGISGFTGKYRPGWIALQHAIQSRTVDMILAVAEDRLARNTKEKDGFSFVCARNGVRWHTLGGGFLDPATAGGKLMATLTGGIAEYESAIKSERVAASVVRRRLEGRDIGGPRPFGFTVDRRSLIESEAELVRMGHRMLLEGKTVYTVLKAFYDSGVPTVKGGDWSYVIVHKILTRPRNAALAVTKEGEEYELTQHPAIVSRADHEAVTALLTPSGQPRGRKPQHLASGTVARCGVCGSPLRFSRQHGGIYRCNAANSSLKQSDGKTHPSVKAADLDARITTEIIPALMARLQRGDNGAGGDESTVRILLAQRAEAQDALTSAQDAMQEMWGMPGVNRPRLKSKVAAAAERVAELDEQITQARASGIGAVQDVATALIEMTGERIAEGKYTAEGAILDTFAAAAAFRTRWAAMSLEDKRDLARAVLEVKIYPASVARKVQIVEGEVVVVREGPERIAIRYI